MSLRKQLNKFSTPNPEDGKTSVFEFTINVVKRKLGWTNYKVQEFINAQGINKTLNYDLQSVDSLNELKEFLQKDWDDLDKEEQFVVALIFSEFIWSICKKHFTDKIYVQICIDSFEPVNNEITSSTFEELIPEHIVHSEMNKYHHVYPIVLYIISQKELPPVLKEIFDHCYKQAREVLRNEEMQITIEGTTPQNIDLFIQQMRDQVILNMQLMIADIRTDVEKFNTEKREAILKDLKNMAINIAEIEQNLSWSESKQEILEAIKKIKAIGDQLGTDPVLEMDKIQTLSDLISIIEEYNYLVNLLKKENLNEGEDPDIEFYIKFSEGLSELLAILSPEKEG